MMLALWVRSVANLHVKDGHGLGEGLGDVHIGVQSQPKHSTVKIKKLTKEGNQCGDPKPEFQS